MNGIIKEVKKDKKIPRIGILTHNYPARALESKDAGKFVYAFAHELAKKTKVFVFCPDFGGKKEKDKEVSVTWLDWGGPNQKFGHWNFFSPLSPLLFAKLSITGSSEVVKFINKNKIDYLLCFWNFPSGVFAWYAKRKLKIHYSTWALGSDIYIYPKLPVVRQIVQLVLNNADCCFGNSYDICNSIRKLCNVNPLFLPTSNLVSLGKHKKPNLDRKKFNFLYLARLEKVKGPDILLDAISLLSRKRVDFTVTFIGDGSMKDNLVEIVKKLGLENIINILGYVEDQRIVNGHLKDADCLVIPSRSESFPLVVTEALQSGLPMIGSNVGDMPKIIGKNKLGYIFQKGNPTSLSKAMFEMIRNGRKIKSKNRSLMSKISTDFKIDRIVDKFLTYIALPQRG